MIKKAFILLMLSFPAYMCFASKSKAITTVSFETVGTYIVLQVKINDSSPLNLILDSGIRNTIITELHSDDQLTLNYSDVKDLMGLGKGENHMEAYSSDYNTLKIGKLKLENKSVLALKEDLFNLSRHTGIKVNGLVGMDILRDYVVDINYSSQKIKFYDRNSYQVPKGYDSLNLQIENQKMFLGLQITNKGISKRVKMMIDTGAELNAWLQTFNNSGIKPPQTGLRGTIGEGLNGEIKGIIARIDTMNFGKVSIINPIISFPDSACIAHVIGSSDRDGTIGSQILSRFNYSIDYYGHRLYYQPNGNLKKKFRYNVAGIEIVQLISGISLTEIWKVWENSPASRAGLQSGDQIMEVNNKNAFEMNISEIRSILETPTRSPLRLTVRRKEKTLTFELNMNNLM